MTRGRTCHRGAKQAAMLSTRVTLLNRTIFSFSHPSDANLSMEAFATKSMGPTSEIPHVAVYEIRVNKIVTLNKFSTAVSFFSHSHTPARVLFFQRCFAISGLGLQIVSSVPRFDQGVRRLWPHRPSVSHIGCAFPSTVFLLFYRASFLVSHFDWLLFYSGIRYELRATALAFEIICAPNESFEDPMMCARGWVNECSFDPLLFLFPCCCAG